MNPEKDNSRGGKRLVKGEYQGTTPAKQSKKTLTTRQKILRVVYLIVALLAALVVVVFAVSRFLFVKPEIPIRNDPKPEESDTVVLNT